MDSPDVQSPHPSPDASVVSFGESSDKWLSPGRFALLLGILIVALFPDVLFGGSSFVFRDFGIFTYPNALFQRESFWRGEFPLWNPLNNCGIPFLAQWNTVCLYPPSLIYLLLPLTWGLTVFLLFHLFWAGFGMYFLAGQWTHNRLAASVAGVAFAFNGMTLNCLMWSSNLSALAWMPWVIFLVERAALSGGRRCIITAALASATQILAGAPEIIVFTWLIIFMLWAGKLIAGRKLPVQFTLRISLITIISALLSAAQLLPFLNLLAHSERTTSYGTDTWAIPQWGWVNLFLPLFHCYCAPLGVYFQPGQDWTSSYYLGIGVIALGLVAIIALRTSRIWMLAALAIFGFVVAHGDAGQLYPLLLKTFPPLGFMRYPIKFAFLTTFTVPLLAAFGAAQFLDGKAKRADRGWKWFIAVVAMIFVSVIGGILWFASCHPLPYEHWSVLCQNGLLRGVFLGLIVGVLLFYGKIINPKQKVVAGIFLLTFFWMDAVTHAPRQNPAVVSSVFESNLLTQQMNPPPKFGETRAFMTRQSHDLVYSSMLTNAAQDYLGRRCALLGDCNLLDDIPVADGFYSLYIREQRGLFMQFFSAPTNAFAAGFADFLGISQVSDSERPLHWQARPSPMPFFSVGAKPEFVELSNVPALLLAGNFDPQKTVYLPVGAKSKLPITNAVQGAVHPVQLAPQRLEFEVAASGPALLVLSQTYYHPWQAYVNGQREELWRANYAFQAVAVPQGKSKVELVYRDTWFNFGLLTAGFALLVCVIGLSMKAR